MTTTKRANDEPFNGASCVISSSTIRTRRDVLVGLIYFLLFPGLVWGIPGFLLSRWLFPLASPLERVATSALFGASTVVPLAFIVPFLSRTPITPTWIIGASALVSVVGAILWRFFPRAGVAPSTGAAQAQGWPVAIGVIAIALIAALSTIPVSFEGLEIWSPCPHQASLFLLEDGTGNGLEAFDPLWGRHVSHLTEHPIEPGYGLHKILRVQRPGSAATLVEAFAFHGSGGLVVASFIYFLLFTAFSALLAAHWLTRAWQVLLLTAIVMLGTRTAAFYMVNENMLAAGLGAGCLALLLRVRSTSAGSAPEAAMVGIVLALTIAVRPIAASYLPAVALLLWPMRRQALAFPIALGIAAVPWLITNYQVFGAALHHPSLEAARTLVNVAGVEVQFHPLNWPFIDELMRPPTEPFPNLFQVPLENLQAFGAIFFLVVLAGAFAVRLKMLLILILWSAPNYLLLLAIVNLDHDKLSYAVLSFAPLSYLAARGAVALRRMEFGTARLVALGIFGATFLVVIPAWLANLELPIDNRRHHNDDTQPYAELNIEERRALLLQSALLPAFNADDATQGLEWSWSLLINGRPVHRGDGPVEGPVHLWCEQLPFSRTFTASLTETPQLSPYVSDTSDTKLIRSYAPVTIELPTTSDRAEVRFERSGEVIVDITVEPADDGTRYLDLAVIDDGETTIQAVTVRVNGVARRLEYHVLERSEGQFQPLVIANYPLSYRTDGSTMSLVAEPWPEMTCDDAEPAGPGEIASGPGALLDNRGYKPLLIRRTADYPPKSRYSCDKLLIRRQRRFEEPVAKPDDRFTPIEDVVP